MRKLQRFSIAIVVASLSVSCALLRINPNTSEVQQARAAAVQIFEAVEKGGLMLEQVQILEIQAFDSGRIQVETHRAFHTRLLITTKLVRLGLTQIQKATSLPELKNTVTMLIDDIKDVQKEFAAQLPLAVGAGLNLLITGLSFALLIL